MNDEYSWEIEEPMVITVRRYGTQVMQMSIHEIIESCSRKDVLQHVAECDRTPWLRRWQNEKYETVVEILKK